MQSKLNSLFLKKKEYVLVSWNNLPSLDLDHEEEKSVWVTVHHVLAGVEAWSYTSFVVTLYKMSCDLFFTRNGLNVAEKCPQFYENIKERLFSLKFTWSCLPLAHSMESIYGKLSEENNEGSEEFSPELFSAFLNSSRVHSI